MGVAFAIGRFDVGRGFEKRLDAVDGASLRRRVQWGAFDMEQR